MKVTGRHIGLGMWLILSMGSAWADDWQPDLHHLDDLPLHSASPVAIEAALNGAQAVKGGGPALFAVTAPLPLGLDDGHWDSPAPGLQRWRTRAHSAGAHSLLMFFSRFSLPEGASLRVYDADGRSIQGPYTPSNHTPEGTLWTAMVPGETGVIELLVPTALRGSVKLELGRIGHAYRNAAQLGDAGACNIDTACPLGNDWRNEARATVKLQIPVDFGLFVGLCTGSLVNNTAQDGRPFVLTADHCGIGDLGSPASGVVVYWNFQNSSCGVNDAWGRQTQSGATLRARDNRTDLSLIELNQAPSASYDVYYAGWDASGAGGSTGVSIHHPAGDAKKISRFTTPLTRATVQIDTLGPEVPAWRVDHWAQGTTEPGSSGAGLWNQDHRIVGTLSGGRADCSGNVGNGEPDFYARLDRQWNATAEPSGQLKAWLDPIAGGCVSIGGKNPGDGLPLTCPDDGAAGSDGHGGGSAGYPWPLALVPLGRALLRRRRLIPT